MEHMHDDGFDRYLWVNNRTLIDVMWEQIENLNQDDTQISGFGFWFDGDLWTQLVQQNEQLGNEKIMTSVHYNLQMEVQIDIWFVGEELWGDFRLKNRFVSNRYVTVFNTIVIERMQNIQKKLLKLSF